MEHLIDDVRAAVEAECWYSALTLALILPDACARIERPREGVGARYAAWADSYFAPYLTPDDRAYMTGRELYRLRCAFLHEADLWLSDDAPQHPDAGVAMFEVLNEVALFVADGGVVPARGMVETLERRTATYSVGVDELCEWICLATEDWLQHARADVTLAAAIDRCRRITRFNPDGTMTRI